MAKKIKGEDGNYYKVKKPFYKKVWFWILVVILVGGIGGAFGGGDEPEATKVESSSSQKDNGVQNVVNENTTEESTEESSEEAEEFHIGDTVSVDGYEITVNTVDYSDGGEFSTPDDGKQFVIINLTITNNTDKKESFNELDYSLNVDGVSSTTGFTYLDGVDTLSSGDLDPSATVTGNLVAQAAPDTSLKLRYEGNMFLQDKEIDIILR